jgi:hypothetical protein
MGGEDMWIEDNKALINKIRKRIYDDASARENDYVSYLNGGNMDEYVNWRVRSADSIIALELRGTVFIGIDMRKIKFVSDGKSIKDRTKYKTELIGITVNSPIPDAHSYFLPLYKMDFKEGISFRYVMKFGRYVRSRKIIPYQGYPVQLRDVLSYSGAGIYSGDLPLAVRCKLITRGDS